MKKYLVNNEIRAEKIRLIDSEGNQVGVIPVEEGKKIAQEKQLDLVLISPNADPPICKIIDFGQFVYQQKKKRKQTKQRGGQTLKELKLSPKMSDNDYQVRLNRGVEFLKKKYKVKLSLFFKGREVMHQQLGADIMQRYIDEIKPYGDPEGELQKSGRSMIININPK